MSPVGGIRDHGEGGVEEQQARCLDNRVRDHDTVWSHSDIRRNHGADNDCRRANGKAYDDRQDFFQDAALLRAVHAPRVVVSRACDVARPRIGTDVARAGLLQDGIARNHSALSCSSDASSAATERGGEQRHKTRDLFFENAERKFREVVTRARNVDQANCR